jgi:hypothetical protein
MKRITAIAILIVGTAVGSVTRASAQQTEVLAKVPFDFVVEGRTLPAGSYRIEPRGDFLLIDSLDGKAAAFATAIQSDTSSNGQAELYFHVVGGERFLRRIASPATRASVELPACKMEKKVAVLRASHDSTEVIKAVAAGM